MPAGHQASVGVHQAARLQPRPGVVGAGRVLADMDAWGYTFRLGTAAAYVRDDADTAWAWLQARGLVDADRRLVPGGHAHAAALAA